MIHGGKNRNKDIIVTANYDDDAKKVEWDNMPPVIALPLEHCKFFDLKRHPYSCIMLAINQIKDASQSLRPKSEVEAQIAQMSINTIKEDPNQYYKIGKEIYSNVDSTVYMCSRKRDGKQFVMKITDKDSAVSEKAKISGEHQLL